MKKRSSDILTRRNFLGRSACSTMALTGVVDTLAHLKLMQSALAQSGPGDYKALVVLFLYGGNDSNNMLIPRRNHPQYANYKANRGILSILDKTVDDGNSDDAGYSRGLAGYGAQYGVHPDMAPVQSLFGSDKLSFVTNVGTLSEPVTKYDYTNNQHKLPPQLFSHADQQIQWQSSLPDQPFRTGWGGRAADLLIGNQGGNVSLSISLAGINSLQVGNLVSQYSVTSSGAVTLAGHGGAIDGSGNYVDNNNGRRLEAFDAIADLTHDHLLEDGYREVVKTARVNEAMISDAVGTIDPADPINAIFDAEGADSSVADQLKMIARLIKGRTQLNNDRQIFFCAAGGYDTHRAQLSAHGGLMGDLAKALSAFQNTMDSSTAMGEAGIGDKVLLITHSDFTRTLTPNGPSVDESGSDHGWGGHQIVMGGPVDGGKIFGTFPDLVVDGPDDAGNNRGRWIPTTSVDQYSAVAADWLGVPRAQLGGAGNVFPNLGRFDDPFAVGSGIQYV